ncbi:MAG: hypothetical protein U1F87_10565 [Kiritimatiellia bacterium]
MIKRPSGTTSATAKTVKTLHPTPCQATPPPPARRGQDRQAQPSRRHRAEGIPAGRRRRPQGGAARGNDGARGERQPPAHRQDQASRQSPDRAVRFDRSSASPDGKIHAAGRTFEFQPTGTDGNIHVTWTVLSVLSFLVSAAALYIILATMMPNLTVPGIERLVSW